MSLDPDVVKTIAPLAREAGIDPANVSKIVQATCESLITKQKAADQAEQQRMAQIFDQQKNEAVTKFGQEGLQLAAIPLGKYCKPGTLFTEMVMSGLGNDPDFIQMCKDFGTLIKPDNAAGSTSGAPTQKPFEQRYMETSVSGK